MTAVEAYIENCPQEHREALYTLREIILAAVPGLTEKISYGMPTFFKKRNIIHFALHTGHIGIYPGPGAIAAFEERLKPYKRSKGAFQIPLGHPLPKQLVMDLARYSAQQAGA